jgi:FkbM family methyltransferase
LPLPVGSDTWYEDVKALPRLNLIERLTAIPSESNAGALLRLPLRILPRQLVVPIVRGPMRGTRWVIGAGIHSCWIGTYEGSVQATLLKLARPHFVAYDIGAHAGYHTLLLSRAVTSSGHVYAFEPSAFNTAALIRHLSLNRASNVTVLGVAVGRHAGRAAWAKGSTTYTGRVIQAQEFAASSSQVEVVAIDDLVRTGAIREPDLIKIDVEGAELDVIDGAIQTLARQMPRLVIATHSDDLDRLVRERLRTLGYAVAAVANQTLVATSEPPRE